YMKFGKDPKVSYHLQLKLADAMIPGFAGLVDESAEKLLCYDWVKMAAESKVLPSSKALFIIQAVYDEKTGEVWLHTHGLARCGLTELEILQSDREHYNEHGAVINTLASRLLDKDKVRDNTAYIGQLTNGAPVVAVMVPWTEGLHEYKNLKFGGADDRTEEHGGDTSLIFFYRSEDDEKNKRLRKVSELDKEWGDNPMFFISNEETERMSMLARERFEYLKMHADNKEYHILIKVGLKTDLPDMEKEHIWFELKGFEGEAFRAVLTQEPFADLGMHTGDEGVYTVDDVTDWIVYTPKVAITPETAYLLRIALI
ncbi:MAG: DUF4026 domain-containing protein, partial [Firmicutes bacterium]|nr:DUF4026 domain-containing protein [Bacillota bacterium]